MMLVGCKAKTDKVDAQPEEQAVEQCCENAAAEAQEDVCYIDENGEVHCTGAAAEEQKCDGNCNHEGECKGDCEKKCDGNCDKEKTQGEAPAKGQCTKCAKCQPCPMDINIPVIIEMVNKAKAAGKVSPELQKEYDALKSHASDCFECGACEGKCPNEVKVIEIMKEAVKLFGK